MYHLQRTVRFAINANGVDCPQGGAGGAQVGVKNGFGGSPSMVGLGRYYEVSVGVRGEPDPKTGYLISIKDIDAAVRSAVVPRIGEACEREPTREPATLLAELIDAVRGTLPCEVVSLNWRLTPTYSVEMTAESATTFVLRQQFDFAAAHRLHVGSMSDEENRATFGRCNNPSGHGHNYRIEPAVEVDLGGGSTPPPFTLADLERVTIETVVDPFDHTHLNEDTQEFGWSTGVNPSVEHIARVFFDRLAPAVLEASDGKARLRSITVWETDRTSCTYPSV